MPHGHASMQAHMKVAHSISAPPDLPSTSPPLLNIPVTGGRMAIAGSYLASPPGSGGRMESPSGGGPVEYMDEGDEVSGAPHCTALHCTALHCTGVQG